MVFIVAAGALLAVAFVTDIGSRRIPNWLTAVGAVVGLIIHCVQGGWNGALFSLAGLLCGFCSMLVLYGMRAVGAGDVKLFGALGALTGAWFVLNAMFVTLIFAGMLAVLILLWRNDRLERTRRLWWSLLQLICFRDREAFRTMTPQHGALRFPLMWAALPGICYAYAAGPLFG